MAGELISTENIKLNDAEKLQVQEIKNSIQLTNSGIMEYGAASQKKIADFSDNVLEGIKTKDLGEVSDMITGLSSKLKGFSIEEKKGFLGFVKKTQASVDKLKSRYISAEKNVDHIVEMLQTHQNQLSKDVVMLDKMYDANLEHYRELTFHILAGKEKLKKERETTLAELQKRATETGLTEDAQTANDFANLCERFEKKLFDLELTRTISTQMAPQIRLVQNSDVLLSDRIQSTITNTIPLWKNQMVLALGVAHVNQAVDAQQAVTDVTNELLRKNAETLRQGSVKVAQANERAIVDIETLDYTNKQLIETFDEILKIQSEGRQKRAEAEGELGRIENELREKLVAIAELQRREYAAGSGKKASGAELEEIEVVEN
jgi:uncharacterized protein YaaN involved in tellurite resistance